MGKIFRQGVEYGGSSNSADCIKYNDTKSVKEAIDEIKASSISNPTASSVTFNNTNTGLAATNVQDAVIEVNGKLPKQCTTMVDIYSINTEPTTFPLEISLDFSQYKKVGIRMSCGYTADYIVDLETIKAQRTHYFTHALIYTDNYYWSVFGQFTENSIRLSGITARGWNFAGISVIGLK